MTTPMPDLTSLLARLDERAKPLLDAFTARMQAIAPTSSHSDSTRDVLLSDLLHALARASDGEALVGLAKAIVRRTPPASPDANSDVERYRHAAQALDWAVRDLLIDQYTAEERRAYARHADLFLEVMRRVALNPNKTGEHTAIQDPSR